MSINSLEPQLQMIKVKTLGIQVSIGGTHEHVGTR
jgi:hypothetical protein